MGFAPVQSAKLPTASWAHNGQSGTSRKTKKPPAVLCFMKSASASTRAFSGLRGVNGLDTMARKASQSLQSKVAAVTFVKPERKSRMVPCAMFERFTEKANKVIMLAREESRLLRYDSVGTPQILLGLIGEDTGIAAEVLKSVGINLKDARVEVEKIIRRHIGFVAVEIPFTPLAKHVLEASLQEARQLGHDYIGTEHLLLALLRAGKSLATRVLENLGADPDSIWEQVIRMVGGNSEAISATVGGRGSGNKMPTLEYGTDLTELAEEGKLDCHLGWQEQIERVIQILGRRTKNSPCLIGEPGVGKTAIAEGLAQRIASGDVPERIQGKRVITLDMGLLVAGTKYRGEFEERLKKLMVEIKGNSDIILFIDEVHTLVGAGAAEGSLDAGNILNPALARGELQCIGATTLDEYRKHIESDPALERIFQPVKVPEPTVDETIQILKGLREHYEIHHKVRYTDEALVAAAKLSHQYISDRFLPDKAIDLIDEAGSQVCFRHARLLPEEAKELEKELRQITKEKNEAVRSEDFEKAGELRDRERDLKAQITALVDENKEMAKAEIEAGVAGRTVTEADIQQIVSFWTSIMVEEKVSTVEEDGSYNSRIKSLALEELKQYFRPEFLNRLDRIVFRQLTKVDVKEISEIMLREVFDRLKSRGIKLRATMRFKDRVVEEVYSRRSSSGGRPLEDINIMRLLEDSLAEKIRTGDIKRGDSVIVDVDSYGKVILLNAAPRPSYPWNPWWCKGSRIGRPWPYIIC